jgi:hypothetical protein
MSTPDDIRFDSWKEIAAYLDRDLRTVRRWERTRALPVHRVPGGEHAVVFAYRGEIDAWLFGTGVQRPSSYVPSQATWTGKSLGCPRANILEPGTEVGTVGHVGPTRASEIKSPQEMPTTGSRLRFRSLGGAILICAVVLSLLLAWIHRSGEASEMTRIEGPPEISSVSPILPQRDQTVLIRGQGFGLHTRYINADTPYIAVRDKTAQWSAGRIVPQNWDEVTLNLKSWDDKEIVVSGFSGAYGSQNWKLSYGDEIEIAVWNPQSGRGPALYHLTVSGPSAH